MARKDVVNILGIDVYFDERGIAYFKDQQSYIAKYGVERVALVKRLLKKANQSIRRS